MRAIYPSVKICSLLLFAIDIVAGLLDHELRAPIIAFTPENLKATGIRTIQQRLSPYYLPALSLNSTRREKKVAIPGGHRKHKDPLSLCIL